MAKIIEVIETYENRGLGTKESIYRQVYQLWTKEGKLIFEKDPCPDRKLKGGKIEDGIKDKR